MIDDVYPLLTATFIAMIALEFYFPIQKKEWDGQWVKRAVVINLAQLVMVGLRRLR